MSTEFRCSCPITSAIDMIGDKWSLVVIKNMLLFDLKTFKDLSETNEKIATNILASRLKALEAKGFITKTKPANNKKTNIYLLTDKGLSLIPIIIELAIWGDTNLNEIHISLNRDNPIEYIKLNKEKFVGVFKDQYLEKVKAAAV